MKRAIPLLCLLLLLLLPAGVLAEEVHGHGHGEGEGGHRSFEDAEYWAGVFDDPARKEWQRPLVILDYLGIQKGDTVADLGAGTGFAFTKALYWCEPVTLRAAMKPSPSSDLITSRSAQTRSPTR